MGWSRQWVLKLSFCDNFDWFGSKPKGPLASYFAIYSFFKSCIEHNIKDTIQKVQSHLHLFISAVNFSWEGIYNSTSTLSTRILVMWLASTLSSSNRSVHRLHSFTNRVGTSVDVLYFGLAGKNESYKLCVCSASCSFQSLSSFTIQNMKKKKPSFSLIFRKMLRDFLSSAKEFHQIINENHFFCSLEVKQAPTTSIQWYITRHQVV